MKDKFNRRVGPAPPVLALVALLLTVATVLTTPLALAKYAATATVKSQGTVALWDVKLSEDISTAKSTAYLDGAHFTTENNGPKTKTFKVKNNSEVAADVTLKVVYVDTDVSIGTVDKDSTSITVGAAAQGVASITAAGTGVTEVTANEVFRLGPGAEATFTVTMQGTTKPTLTTSGSTSTLANDSSCMRRYKVYFKSVQVD